jgi:chromate transporter
LFYGIKPAVTALVVHAAWRVGTRALKNGWLLAIAVAAVRRDLRAQAALPAHRAGGRAGRLGRWTRALAPAFRPALRRRASAGAGKPSARR